ncbi:hypothetical protein XOC_1275 [Xanthomonas oryzae pv. oryzicola BLS256]|uniref:Uncharacterized protein n=1 Tax=Xanthomonas oryzae pv. oryzicola (strain BLS256) TaxID=383407 RepID=G7TH74_XANOB|nr:hypothetical protein XOC_1275 [Xanthomonas oryzae pv. oryzicola BLS256]
MVVHVAPPLSDAGRRRRAGGTHRQPSVHRTPQPTRTRCAKALRFANAGDPAGRSAALAVTGITSPCTGTDLADARFVPAHTPSCAGLGSQRHPRRLEPMVLPPALRSSGHCGLIGHQPPGRWTRRSRRRPFGRCDGAQEGHNVRGRQNEPLEKIANQGGGIAAAARRGQGPTGAARPASVETCRRWGLPPVGPEYQARSAAAQQRAPLIRLR